MSRGFITLGIDTGEDRIKYCYALACSIKLCDPKAEVCLVVDKGRLDFVSDVFHHAFDYIVELPYGNSAYKDGFHGMNLWQLYHVTPFDETIYLDYDTLFIDVNMENCFSNSGKIRIGKSIILSRFCIDAFGVRIKYL